MLKMFHKIFELPNDAALFTHTQSANYFKVNIWNQWDSGLPDAP